MRKKKINVSNLLIHIFFCVLCLMVLYPFWCIFSASLVTTEEVAEVGFSLWPQAPSFQAYTELFQRSKAIFKAYGTTFFVSICSAFLGVLTSASYAYAVSRKSFRMRRVLAFIATFTMYFSGGMAASYIVNVNILHLKNNILILILPGTFSVMQMVIIRSFFDSLPYGLIESAKLDGANEYTTFFRIMLPLAKPALATVCLMLFVSKWNSYYEAMMYMDTGKHVTIQLLLHRMMQEVDFIKSYAGFGLVDSMQAPSEALRMAMCVITVLPMLCVFPFFQKYFVKGMAIGSVKG